MGLRMDDMHAPTVPSGPSTSKTASFDATNDKRSLMELIDLKTKLEEELSALGGVLESHGVDMTTPLTTADDFPRSDIDVAQIRTTRSRIVRLKNDYKAVMQRIEAGLHAQHAEYRASSAVQSSSSSTHPTNAFSSLSFSSSRTQFAQHDVLETPFAKVHTVAADSPAEEAGLRPGDKLRRFGDVTWMNHEKLSKVAEVVQRSQGRRVIVKISRATSGGEDEELELGLTPRAGWGGRGLLGCQILPL